MPDLESLAHDNVERLRQEVTNRTAAAPDRADLLARFAAAVRDTSGVSLNLRNAGLIGLLATGRHLNIHDVAERMAEEFGADAERILRRQLGPWYDRRIAFDDAFTGGRTFHYACLHIGGMGPTMYGEYCVVLHAGRLAAAGALTYLREDSARDYVDAAGAVDVPRVAADIAPHEGREWLAALKCEPELTNDESEWPKTLCSNDGYIEAIFVTAEVRGAISTVRIGRKRHSELYDLILDRYRRTLTELEKAVVDDFVTVSSLMKDAGLKLEVLDD